MSTAARLFFSSTHRFVQTFSNPHSTSSLGPSQESIEKKILEEASKKQLAGYWSVLVQHGSIETSEESKIKQLYEVIARTITSEMNRSIHSVKGYIHAPLFDPIIFSAKNMNALGRLLDQNGSLSIYFIQESYDAMTEEQRNVYRALVSNVKVIEGPLLGADDTIPLGLAGATYLFKTEDESKFTFSASTDTKKMALWWGQSHLPPVSSRLQSVAKFLYDHSPFLGT